MPSLQRIGMDGGRRGAVAKTVICRYNQMRSESCEGEMSEVRKPSGRG